MSQSLRERQKRVAKEAILRATADEIAQHGLEPLSLQVVADRAGVSLRTVYNYFDSREALLRGLRAWSDELTVELGGHLRPTGLDHLPEMVCDVWRAWAAQGHLYPALTKVETALFPRGQSPERRERHAVLTAAVAERRPDLDDDQCRALASLFHALASGPTFQRLTHEDELATDDAARLVAWAVSVLRDALDGGQDPYHHEEQTT